MSLTLRLAWRNLWRHPRRTWLTAGAMIFSNVLLVFLISVQLGTYGLMIENSLSIFTGHIQIQQDGYLDGQKMRQVVPEAATLAERLRDRLAFNTIAARGAAYALASSADRSYGIQIAGVEPRFEGAVSTLPGLVRRGRYLDQPTAAEIVIGAALARNLKAGVGDELTILGSGLDGSFAAAVVDIVGIFESGSADFDRGLAEIPLAFFQDTFAMADAGHQVVIQAPSLAEVDGLAAEIEGLLPPNDALAVLDWTELQPGLRQAIQADFVSAWFMYAVLIVLVAFGVLNTQLMSVLERTKEFGIVMSLGMSPWKLGRLVLLETFLLGLLGLTTGALLGSAIVYWFSVHGFTYPGLGEMAGQFNLPDRIYPSISALSLLLGPTVVFLGSLFAAVYPAARLHRLEPVAAMRAA